MNEEMIDLLNPDGTPTGKVVSRTSIHLSEQPHEVIHIWAINEKGELLIQKRSEHKKQYANVWDISLGEHISAGDTPLQSAQREAAEELGVNLPPKDLTLIGRLNVAQIVPETGLLDNEWANAYLVRLDSNTKLKLQTEEVKDTKWISLDQYESEIRDPERVKNYLNHPPSYLLETVAKIRSLIA
jgi:isopentenyldiphosphate isomerase